MFSSLKRNEILIDVPTWANLENMLIERSQIQNATYHITVLL